jgi:hypothetical protein
MTVLLSFGDSWTYGAELPTDTREQDNYTGQLADLLQAKVVKNFSEVGSAVTHLQLQLRQAINFCRDVNLNDRVIATFFITGQERFLFFDQRGDFASLTPSGYIARPVQQDLKPQFEKIYDFYYQNIQSTQADLISLNTNLLALQSICRRYRIEDYYISGWQTLDLWPEVDRQRIYARGQKHCGHLLELDANLKNDQYLVPRGSHPNRQGHAIIAKTLHDMIKKS